ncbi:MAG: ArsA family ATPase, partial [Nocardioides sp.]|nr:ArsA family ATPase [Nocardioides sp.]
VSQWRSVYRAEEPVGVEALRGLAGEVYADTDPLARPEGDGPMQVTRTETGAVLRLALPFVTHGDVDLARHGDELVVTVGSYRRLLSLPSGLARHQVRGAKVDQGSLQVRFEETQA